MAGKTAREAVQNFLTPLQQALSCVSMAIIIVGKDGYRPRPQPHVLTLSHNPARLGRDGHLALKMVQHYRVVRTEPPRGPWKVQIVAYYYTLEKADEDGTEMFSYHWHPEGRSPIAFPHLHLHQCMELRRPDGRDAHFPTERVSLDEVLRLVITDFAVIPRQENWAEILENTQAAFRTWRTWP